MTNKIEQSLSELFEKQFKQKVKEITKLPISGSARQYFRLKSEKFTVIGTYNEDKKENRAFIEFSRHFKARKQAVPEIYTADSDKNIYLQEDLGDDTLYNILQNLRNGNQFPEAIIPVYKKVISKLIDIQTKGGEGLDYSFAYPRADFDKQAILWDLNYFKYHFLKLAHILFDEQLLEDDFQHFSEILLQADCSNFMFRDFQSRNIMLKNDEVYFIDYQGGRRGALQYDLASLLFDAKAEIPNSEKENLKNYYISELQKRQINTDNFNRHFYAYALVRIMQAMGAYGYRGLFEGKPHFTESIPPAVENLKYLLTKLDFTDKIPHLTAVLKKITVSEQVQKLGRKPKLTVSVQSFSYKRGIPYDRSGNGGGFIFDCRYLKNPGRIDRYKSQCGKDIEVIEYLENQGEIQVFLDNVYRTVKPAIETYRARGFKNLSISFGCTGGQHRSVYSAEHCAKYLSEHFDIEVDLKHTEGW